MPFSQGLVRVGGEPASVAPSFMTVLQERLARIWDAGGLEMERFQPGDDVIVKEGMFEGYRAVFDAKLSGRDRVRVLLQMLNDRYLPVELDVGQLEASGTGNR